MLDKASVRRIAQDYASEVRKTLDPQKVILFGSYVNGNPHEWSDIDIAVVFNDFRHNAKSRKAATSHPANNP